MTIPSADDNVTATPESDWPSNDDGIPIVVLGDPLSSSSFTRANYHDGNIVVSARPVGSNNNNVSGAGFAPNHADSERLWSQVHEQQQQQHDPNGLDIVEAQPVVSERTIYPDDSSSRGFTAASSAAAVEQPLHHPATATAVPVNNGNTNTALAAAANTRNHHPPATNHYADGQQQQELSSLEQTEHENENCVCACIVFALFVATGLFMYVYRFAPKGT